MNPFAINFYIRGKPGQFAFRRLAAVPPVGDLCVFNDIRYEVRRVEWCLDVDATEVGTRINVELASVK